MTIWPPVMRLVEMGSVRSSVDERPGARAGCGCAGTSETAGAVPARPSSSVQGLSARYRRCSTGLAGWLRSITIELGGRPAAPSSRKAPPSPSSAPCPSPCHRPTTGRFTRPSRSENGRDAAQVHLAHTGAVCSLLASRRGRRGGHSVSIFVAEHAPHRPHR